MEETRTESHAGKTETDPAGASRGESPLRVLRFSRWPEVRPFWEELNRTHKGGELALDYRAHQIIWERFMEPRGYELEVHVVLEGDRCIGIFPLSRSRKDPFGTTCWSLSDDFIIAREYFCPESRIRRVIDLIPPHFTDDMSCFYRPADTTGFQQEAGGVIDVKESREAYLASLRGSARRDFLHTFRVNEDVRVERDSRVREEEMEALLEGYLRYRRKVSIYAGEGHFEYSHDKVLCDLALMRRAEEMSRLVALYFRLNDELVAANFSVLRETDRVDDYLCVRTDDAALAKRGLGIFAILANMDACRELGVRFYDMSANRAAYKAKFANLSMSYFFLRHEVEGIPESSSPEP